MWSSRILQRKPWTLERMSENFLDRTRILSITRPHLVGTSSERAERQHETEDRYRRDNEGRLGEVKNVALFHTNQDI